VKAGTEQTCLINPPIKKFLLPGYVWRVFREDGWVWRAMSLRLPSHRSSPSRSGDFDSELTLVKKVYPYCEQPPSFVPAAAILVRIL
jgi:hypothetical protein